jgi:hypothetical protein
MQFPADSSRALKGREVKSIDREKHPRSGKARRGPTSMSEPLDPLEMLRLRDSVEEVPVALDVIRSRFHGSKNKGLPSRIGHALMSFIPVGVWLKALADRLRRKRA